MGTRRAVKSVQHKSPSPKVPVKPVKKERVDAAQVVGADEDVVPRGDGEFEASGERSPFSDDPVVDRRIIEGMLHDRPTLMAEMQKLGYGQNAVLRRAAELGLSEALIRQVKGVAEDLAGEKAGRKAAPVSLGARTCLCCDRVFLSTGTGNRLCMRCRGGDAGLAQL